MKSPTNLLVNGLIKGYWLRNGIRASKKIRNNMKVENGEIQLILGPMFSGK
jgi:hypothetical protein